MRYRVVLALLVISLLIVGRAGAEELTPSLRDTPLNRGGLNNSPFPPLNLRGGGEAGGVIGFNISDASRIVVELEVCRTLQEQMELYRQSNAELEKQVSLLEKVVELQTQEIEMSQTVIKNQKEMMEAQGKAYEATIKASKPNPFRLLIDSIGLIGAGVLAGALLL